MVSQFWFMNPSQCSELLPQGILLGTSRNFEIVTLSFQIDTCTLFKIILTKFNFDGKQVTAKFVLQCKHLRDFNAKLITVVTTRTLQNKSCNGQNNSSAHAF